ncbi:MAG: hypothetical protein CML20_12470 [Rheinheimera sp.]|uniref:hypothetical protein n=1 Tax=Arsukibacterium sp. UBA3155 TaxID=1946058 RepID=UPI000C94BD2C|nr:hypothetical protein [Arsukibacterium sp. UBA3155]MAD75579.1 hypothetical protein [Rheinheimera sp.]|tara:strand:- start:1216 stop:1680 length:465 start_codon:yes stop_codon:yes gene_type:complete
MTHDIKKSGQELLTDALNELIANPAAKINMNTVAKQAGVNHSLFRKGSYSQIRTEVLKAQKVRDTELENKSKDEKISMLQVKLKAAENKLQQLSEQSQMPLPKTVKEIEGAMMARLVEMYRFNDLLKTQLAEKHGEKIDEETGEIIEINFGKRS